MRVYHDLFWYQDPDQRFLIIGPDPDPGQKHNFKYYIFDFKNIKKKFLTCIATVFHGESLKI